MPTTTLTREKLLAAAAPSYTTVEVAGFGVIGLRSQSELQRSRRIAALFDDAGNLRDDSKQLRRVYMIIDQVMASEKTPLFTDADALELGSLDGEKLDPLIAAIVEFNGDDEGNEPAG